MIFYHDESEIFYDILLLVPFKIIFFCLCITLLIFITWEGVLVTLSAEQPTPGLPCFGAVLGWLVRDVDINYATSLTARAPSKYFVFVRK